MKAVIGKRLKYTDVKYAKSKLSPSLFEEQKNVNLIIIYRSEKEESLIIAASIIFQ
jgi:hypothetical protein